MLFLNFSHPLSESQERQLEAMSGQKIEWVENINVQFNTDLGYAKQIINLIESIDLSPEQWQKQPIMINPPSFNSIAVVLLAELHGRMGYFPPCVRIRQVNRSLPPQFEVAEILNLSEIREQARKQR